MKNETLFRSQTSLLTESFGTLYKFLNSGENCVNMKMYDSKLQEADLKEVLQSPTLTTSNKAARKKKY